MGSYLIVITIIISQAQPMESRTVRSRLNLVETKISDMIVEGERDVYQHIFLKTTNGKNSRDMFTFFKIHFTY